MANNNSTSNVQRWFFVAEKPSLMREVQKCYRNHQKDIINLKKIKGDFTNETTFT